MLEEQAQGDGVETASLTGRLLELDFAQQSFRVHAAGDQIETIVYGDIMEQVVRDAFGAFVLATVSTANRRDLLSFEIIEDVPESRFNERPSLQLIAREQGILPLADLDQFAIPDLEGVPYDEFELFVKTLRRGNES